MPDTLWPVVVGALSALVTNSLLDWFKDMRVRRRERDARAHDERQRHILFQRQTLDDLQEAVGELGRTAAMMSVANRRSYKETGQWKASYGDDLNERARFALARASRLGARIADDEVRKALSEMQHWWWGVPLAATREESEDAYKQVERLGGVLNERVGALLRQPDVGTAPSR
jgi:hypothetical protein